MNRADYRETVGLACFVGLFVLVSRLPFINFSYALDGDAWYVARAARQIAETKTYVLSRPPGFPLYEMVCAVIWPLGPIASNGLTAVVSAIAAALFSLLVRRLGATVGLSMLAGIALSFVPIVYINSTVTLDYLWALAGILAAVLAAWYRRPALAGLCLGAAVGCRITSGAMILPLALVLLCHESTPRAGRRVVVFVLSTLLTGAVLYLPVYVTYGIEFLRFVDVSLDPATRSRLALYGGTIGVWGALGTLGLGVGVLAFLVRPRWSVRNAGLSSRRNVRILGAAAVAVLLYAVLFVRLPIEYAYFIPAVPFALLILLHLVHRTVGAGILLLMILSPFFAHVDYSLSAALRGPLFDDAEKRRNQIHYLERAYEDIRETQVDAITVVAGTETEKFEAMPPIRESLRFWKPVEVVGELEPARVQELLDEGQTLYFLHKGVFHVDQGYVLQRPASGGYLVRIQTYADPSGVRAPALSTVTALDEAVVLARLVPSVSHESQVRSAFGSARMFVPGYDDAGEAGGFRPAAVEFEGRLCIPAFDTPERMEEFRTDEITHLVLSGEALLASIGSDLDIALNLDTPYARRIVANGSPEL